MEQFNIKISIYKEKSPEASDVSLMLLSHFKIYFFFSFPLLC